MEPAEAKVSDLQSDFHNSVIQDSLPLLSVCVVTYNHERFIAKCLEGAIMQQTTFPFEIVVGEDCSTDGTRSIVRKYASLYPDLVRPVYLDQNVGAARNNFEFVYRKLRGKYIAICDGDDYWTDPYKLQKQVDFLEQNPECVMCFHQIDMVDANNDVQKKNTADGIVKYYSWQDIIHISIPTLSVVYRNCIREFPKEIFDAKSGDTFLFGMLSAYGGAADIGQVSAAYRIHPTGVFQSKSTLDKFRQTLDTRRKMKNSSFFNLLQKKELRKELRRRKIRYMKHFLKKGELYNFVRIMIA